MGISPDYGDTPLSGDELDAVLPTLAELLGTTPGKSALYDFEQAIHVNVAQKLMDDAINGRLAVESIVTERFIRDFTENSMGRYGHGRELFVAMNKPWGGSRADPYRDRERPRHASLPMAKHGGLELPSVWNRCAR